MRIVDSSEDDVETRLIFRGSDDTNVRTTDATVSRSVASADDALCGFAITKKPRLECNTGGRIEVKRGSSSDLPSSGTISSASSLMPIVKDKKMANVGRIVDEDLTDIRAMSVDDSASD